MALTIMHRRFSTLSLMLLLAGSSGAQELAFDVSTVRPTPAMNDGRTHINYPAGGDFSASNVTALELVAWAYDMPAKRILNAPDWMNRQRFDLQAKTSVNTDARLRALSNTDANAETRSMVRGLLADRFAVILHSETQLLSALDMVVDGSPKLKESTGNGKRWDSGRTSLRGTGLTAAILADLFCRVTGKVVVDRTGLDGRYDVSLQWSADDVEQTDTTLPGFFRAVPEQLGLKLVPAKEQLDVLLIDHAEAPSEN